MSNGDVVAVGIIWTSRVHGDRYWIAIVVRPDQRRTGLGRRMFEHLSTLRASDLPFITRGFVDDVGMRFADAVGARTIQVVPPAMISVASRVVLPPSRAAAPAYAVAWDDVIKANSAIYAWTHAAWSPVSGDFESALAEGLDADVDIVASSVVVDMSGSIRGLALAYLDTEPPLITAETTDPHDPDGERVIADAVRRTLDVFASRGVENVTFDGHVSDPHFMPVWARLAPTGRWSRLVEIPPASGLMVGERPAAPARH